MAWTASVHTLHIPNHVKTFVFKVLRNGLPQYIHTIHMPKHVIYDSVRAQSATEWTASVGK